LHGSTNAKYVVGAFSYLNGLKKRKWICCPSYERRVLGFNNMMHAMHEYLPKINNKLLFWEALINFLREKK